MTLRSAPDDSLSSTVRRNAGTPAVFAVVATIGFAVTILVRGQYMGQALRIFIAVIGTTFVWLAGAVLSDLYRSDRRPQLELSLHRPPAEQRRPLQLEEIEQHVRFAQYSALDYDRRLRPLLRELAAERLAATSRIDVSSDPQAARSRLGGEFWQAVYGEQAAQEREEPGPSLSMLRSLIEALESL